MRLILITAITFFLSIAMNAQSKINKIYVFDFTTENNAAVLTNPLNVSSFNTTGYVNQPYFISGQQLLVNSDHADQKFTDIYSLNLTKKTIERITDTKGVSEFSPTISKDGNSIYCVRIESDGKTQTMWQYPSNKSNSGKRLLKKLNNIGYYQFLNDKQIVGFAVGTPSQLGIFDIEGNLVKLIDENPGRSFQIDFAGNVYYSTVQADGQFLLKKFNKLSGAKESLITLPSQYFNMLTDGNIISSKESKLFIYNYQNKTMDIWADLTKYSINNISRIATKDGKLAIVAE